MGICTIWHWQTTGQLVQELNVCTVHVLNRNTEKLIVALINSSLNTYLVFTYDIHRDRTTILKSINIVHNLGYQLLGKIAHVSFLCYCQMLGDIE